MPTGTRFADATPSPPPGSQSAPVAGRRRGGTLRLPLTGATWDTFDADRTRSPDVARLLGYTHRGIVHYRFPESGDIEGELAGRWEQPDPLTLVFHLAPGVQWQDAPGRSARPTTPGDLRVHIERNRDGDPATFPRRQLYAQVERIETPDLGTVRVLFRRPDPFFLATLAGPFARVQAPELLGKLEQSAGTDPSLLVGTGRFRLADFSPTEGYAVRRAVESVGIGPWLDEIRTVSALADQPAVMAAFEAKAIDALVMARGFDPASLAPVDAGMANVVGVDSLMPIGGGYVPTGTPWGHPGLAGAVFRALDRRQVLAGALPTGWRLSGNVPPPQSAWGFSDPELGALPGYLADRDRDGAEARALWAAGGGPGLGPVTVDVPDVVNAQLPGLGPAIVGNLAQVLGGAWELRVEPYATVERRIREKAYGSGANRIWFGYLAAVASPDPSLDLFTLYNSSGPGFAGLSVPRIDELTSRAVAEMDVDTRKDLCRGAATAIHEHWGAGLLYIGAERLNTVRWGYVAGGPPSSFPNSVNTWREVSLDSDHPSFTGRPPA